MFGMRNKQDNISIRTLVWRPGCFICVNFSLISYPLIQTCVLGAQGDRLIETVLLSTHTICFVLLFIDPDKEILFA